MIRNRTLIILVLLGALSLGAGWYFGPGREPATLQSAEAGTLVFPGLAERLAQAHRIEILHQGKTLVIEQRPDGIWGLADRDLYPVQTGVLRAILTGLTELRLTELRTSDPSKFARLGVEDPNQPDGTSNLLRVLDGGGKPLAEILLGHRRVRTQGNVPESVYVRRPGQNQAWLAEGKLEVSADRQTLIDRDILSIAPARIVGVVSTKGKERLEFIRDGDKLVLSSPAAHPALEAYRLDDISGALDGLTLIDVRRAQEPPAVPTLGDAVFTAIDGLTVRVTMFKNDKDLWARFAVSGPEAISADVKTLNARLAGWEFQLNPWKEKTLLPTLEDLKVAPAKDAAPATPSASKP